MYWYTRSRVAKLNGATELGGNLRVVELDGQGNNEHVRNITGTLSRSSSPGFCTLYSAMRWAQQTLRVTFVAARVWPAKNL